MSILECGICLSSTSQQVMLSVTTPPSLWQRDAIAKPKLGQWLRELRLLAVLTNGFGITARILKFIRPYGLNLAMDQSFRV